MKEVKLDTVIFSPDQHMAMLSWLEHQKEAGLSLEEVIEGLKHGTLTDKPESD